MINFRFHLVSLVAVFLALGLGILVGSTVDRPGNRQPARHRDQQRAQGEQRSARPTNKQLAKQNSQLQQFIDLVAPFAVDGRLDEQSVAVSPNGRRRRRGEADRAALQRGGRRCARGAVARRLVAARHRRARPGARSRRSAAGRPRRRCATPRSTCSRAGSPRRRSPTPTTTTTATSTSTTVVGARRRPDDHDLVAAATAPTVDALDRARAGRLPQRHRRQRVGVRHASRPTRSTCS